MDVPFETMCILHFVMHGLTVRCRNANEEIDSLQQKDQRDQEQQEMGETSL